MKTQGDLDRRQPAAGPPRIATFHRATLALVQLADEPAALRPAPHVQRSRRRGERVPAWTVDGKAEMVRLVDPGVDWLITERADVARRLAERCVQAAAGREPARLRAFPDGQGLWSRWPAGCGEAAP